MSAGRRLPRRMAGDDSRLLAMAAMLAREFRRWDFGTREVRDHVALEAMRRDGGPGVCVVITEDAGEMRRALAGDLAPPDTG